MTQTHTEHRYLIDAVREQFPNAEPVHGHGPDSAIVVAPHDGYIVITRDEMTTYTVGIYTAAQWEQMLYDADGDPAMSDVPADPAVVVRMLDTLTSPPEGVDWSAWATQWIDDAIADGRIPNPNAHARRRYTDLVRRVGLGFHPDTPGADYGSLPEGITAEVVDEIVEVALAAGVDVHGLALDVMIDLADEVEP